MMSLTSTSGTGSNLLHLPSDLKISWWPLKKKGFEIERVMSIV